MLDTESQYCTMILKRCCATSKNQVPCSKLINYYDNKELIVVYFVINEFFCNSLIMLLCIAKEVLFKQVAQNKILCTKVSLQLFVYHAFFP